MPDPFGGEELDASPFLLALLPSAMASGEPLEVDGPVSPRMFEGLDDVMRVYRSFYPDAMRAVKLEAEQSPPGPGRETTACFFSRGVDSWYSVLAERTNPGKPRLEQLVHVLGIDVMYEDEEIERRALAEVRRAAHIARLELVVAETNVRSCTDPVLDWNPMHGAGLGAIALALRPARMLTPSAYMFGELMPAGSHPMLDHRFSTERTNIVIHGDATRLEKVQQLAAWPEALAQLKVCFSGNIPGNCGDCSKCIHTMLELHVAGVEPSDAGFDRPLTPARVASTSFHPAGAGRYRETLAGLRQSPADAELAAAFELAVLRGEGHAVHDNLRAAAGGGYEGVVERAAQMVALLDAQAGAPTPAKAVGAVIGLVRALDHERGRHVYGLGTAPRGELAGELGALLAFRHEDSVALWVDRLGCVCSEWHSPAPPARPGITSAARFIGAPLRWPGDWSPATRLRTALERGAMLRAALLRGQARKAGAGEPAAGDPPAPLAYLHSQPGSGRTALYSAIHPITGDQLLTTSELEAADFGYGPATRLGYLLDQAPVTGRLGIAQRPLVSWVSRLGQVAR